MAPCSRSSAPPGGCRAVYVPHHAGFLSTSLGWKLTFGIFLWHWIYGYFLGTVYCPAPHDTVAPDA